MNSPPDDEADDDRSGREEIGLDGVMREIADAHDRMMPAAM